MAKNLAHLEKPSLSDTTSGEEEEEVFSKEIVSSDSGSESEEVYTQSSAKPQKSPSSSDDEDSGSDTDSGGQMSKVKPLATKHIDERQKTASGKQRSKPSVADNATPEKPITAKRLADVNENDAKHSKKLKKKLKPEPEQVHTQFLKKPSSISAQSSAKPQQYPSSSDDEDSGSDTDSGGQMSKVKPLVTKPIYEPPKTASGKHKSKPNVAHNATPEKPISAKRPADVNENDSKDSKKLKKKQKSESESLVKQSAISGGDSKKPSFQRIWSEDDEIVILEGMIEYVEKNKCDPVTDLLGFHVFIKKNLHADFTRAQLQDKIRKLKKKYENKRIKEKEGNKISFSKPHEQKLFELSKGIWGYENVKESVVGEGAGNSKSSGSAGKNTRSKRVNTLEDGKANEVKNKKIENGDTPMLWAWQSIVNSKSVGEIIFRTGAELLVGEKKQEIERGLRKLRLEQMELCVKQMDLLCAETKLVLAALKSSDY